MYETGDDTHKLDPVSVCRDIENIRLRPCMYIGFTDQRGILQLFMQY